MAVVQRNREGGLQIERKVVAHLQKGQLVEAALHSLQPVLTAERA